jgi:predicted lipoprotein with Yx(FWY)xxD motif
MNTTRSLLALAVTAAVLAAGGLLARSSLAATKASVSVGKSNYGQILFDGRGYALYAFTRDPRGRATCYGACAKAWPPFVVKVRPSAGNGTKSSLIGTVRRRDGKLQVTYGGRPLYYYVGDTRPGLVLCQDVNEFGGLWLVVRGTGKLVR